jgi:hypothetical protein
VKKPGFFDPHVNGCSNYEDFQEMIVNQQKMCYIRDGCQGFTEFPESH